MDMLHLFNFAQLKFIYLKYLSLKLQNVQIEKENVEKGLNFEIEKAKQEHETAKTNLQMELDIRKKQEQLNVHSKDENYKAEMLKCKKTVVRHFDNKITSYR